MAEPVDQISHPDDFEQLSHVEAEDIITSTSENSEPDQEAGQGDDGHAQDLLTGTSEEPEAENPPFQPQPLINFDDAEIAESITELSKSTDSPVEVCDSPKEEIPKKCCCAFKACFDLIDPRVIDLLYWRDIKKSSAVLVSSLSLLLSLALCSVISVIAYSALIVLTITVTFRLYKTVMGTVQKSAETHPFKNILDIDFNVDDEKVHHYADIVVNHGTKIAQDLRHYMLIEDMVDSLKFALCLYVLTYIGYWFNGLTLIIMADIGVFSVPKLYDMYKSQIDQYLGLVCGKVHETYALVQEKIPFLAKRKQE